jgi:hypothetical protein
MAILSHLLVAVLAASAALGAPSHAAPAEIQRRAPSAADQKTYLDLHNTLRAKHHASALTWNQTLSNAAASWAGKCVFQHSGGKLGPYGENLSAGFPLDVKGAVQMWINEECKFYFLLCSQEEGVADGREQRNTTRRARSTRTTPRWCGRAPNSSGAPRPTARPAPSSRRT